MAVTEHVPAWLAATIRADGSRLRQGLWPIAVAAAWPSTSRIHRPATSSRSSRRSGRRSPWARATTCAVSGRVQLMLACCRIGHSRPGHRLQHAL